MVSIRDYFLKKVGSLFYVCSYEVINCPICGETLIVIGIRRRQVTNDEGEKITLVIRRLRCKGCRKIHHELPDMIIPYKRHCAETYEKVINNEGDVCCDDNMIRRIKAWWASRILYFMSVLASLREKLNMVFSDSPAPKEIVRAVVNAHLWIHTRSEFLSG